MAVVSNYSTTTSSHNQRRILTRNKGVKIRATINIPCKMPGLNFPLGPGPGAIESLNGVMSEKKRSNTIIFKEPLPPMDSPSKTDEPLLPPTKKDCKKVSIPKKKKLAATNNPDRKSLRLILRSRELELEEKCSKGVPLPGPIEMARTVEFFKGPPVRSEQYKSLYLAGLGLYRTPDDRGWPHQQQLLQDECDKFISGKVMDVYDCDSSTLSKVCSPPTTPKPRNISKSKTPEIEWPSPMKIMIRDANYSEVENKTATNQNQNLPDSTTLNNWGVNMTVVIQPATVNENSNTDSNNDFSQISSENGALSDYETSEASPESENSLIIDEEEDEWQYFTPYVEDQLKNETEVSSKFSKSEIEEAKLKVAKYTTQWAKWLKGS